jgi:putative ABC transport system permease protein
MVGREFLMLIAISTGIALPIAVVASQNYLASFIERAPIGAWPMLIAILAAVLVTVLSTLQHTMSALRLSPVKILRE